MPARKLPLGVGPPRPRPPGSMAVISSLYARLTYAKVQPLLRPEVACTASASRRPPPRRSRPSRPRGSRAGAKTRPGHLEHLRLADGAGAPCAGHGGDRAANALGAGSSGGGASHAVHGNGARAQPRKSRLIGRATLSSPWCDRVELFMLGRTLMKLRRGVHPTGRASTSSRTSVPVGPGGRPSSTRAAIHPGDRRPGPGFPQKASSSALGREGWREGRRAWLDGGGTRSTGPAARW